MWQENCVSRHYQCLLLPGENHCSRLARTHIFFLNSYLILGFTEILLKVWRKQNDNSQKKHHGIELIYFKCTWFIQVHLEPPASSGKETSFMIPSLIFGVEAMCPHHVETSSKPSRLFPKYWIKNQHETVFPNPLKVSFKLSFLVKNFPNCQWSMPENSIGLSNRFLHFLK